MWILSKNGKELYNLDHIANLYLPPDIGNKGPAVKCSFSDCSKKDLTLGTYNASDQAISAIRYVYDALARGAGIIQMPDEDKLSVLGRVYETKERSATGKKSVRRGGS